MNDLQKLLKEHKGKVLLAIFPHPNDESFLTGGLLQKAHECGLLTSLICLTQGAKGENKLKSSDLKKTRTKELEKACRVLSINECVVWDYTDSSLQKEVNSWTKKIEEEIQRLKPSIVVTFDQSGFTGHPDHITVHTHVMSLLRNSKSLRPTVLLRVPEAHDKKHFRNNKAMPLASTETHTLSFGLRQALTKIKAIYTHASQIPGLLYKLHIIDTYLFHHHERYHVINPQVYLPRGKAITFIHI